MSKCRKENLTTATIEGGQLEFADKPLFTHLQEEMSRNSSQVNLRVIQGLTKDESRLVKKYLQSQKPKLESEKTIVPVRLSSESLRRSERLKQKEKKITMSAASYTAALDMASKTKTNTASYRSTRTGTNMGEAMFSPAPRLKRTVSFVTGLSDLGETKKKLKMEDVKVLESQFAACTVAPKSTTEVVWTPISGKGILMRNIGSVLDTTATPASISPCSTVSTVPPAHTLHASNALTTDFFFE